MTAKHDVQVFSPPRSGSTLVRGMIYDLLGSGVPPQSQDVELIDCKQLVVVYRDFRDSAASLWRVTIGGFASGEGWRMATREEAINAAHKMAMWAARLASVNHSDRLDLRYEGFRGKEHWLVLRLAAFVDPTAIFKAGRLLQIADKWDINNVRDIARTREGWLDWDKEYQIHGIHVYRDGTSCWRELFPASSHEEVNRILDKPLRKWGYVT